VKYLTLVPSQLPFNLDLSLSCGQIFGWKKSGNTWVGIHKNKFISIRQSRDRIWYCGATEDEITRFLGLTDSMDIILTSIREHINAYRGESDDFFETMYHQSSGLRILRQDPWECLVSFICSANSNVSTISKRIGLILQRHGTPCTPHAHAFPDPQTMSRCSEHELRACLSGYRAPYLIKTAQYIHEYPGFFDQVAQCCYDDAKKILMTLPGVGPKVADCVLLFAFEHLNAVPVDIRIRKIMEREYADLMPPSTLKRRSYESIASFCREYFGPYAGYAQQFLFATRDTENDAYQKPGVTGATTMHVHKAVRE